jgi:spermidine synthase
MTTPKAHRGLSHSLAIWLLVFAGGWFVMLTELVGARVLAPYFGNTIYVWGSVIAIFMFALALGYALGGRMTQRLSSALVPAGLVAAAGIYVALSFLYQDALCAWLYNTGMHVKWGALVAATILYGPPMALLGAISPYCVQIASRSHVEVGKRAGSLYSISTMGSFIGCLVTAFVLIPEHSLWQITLCGGVVVAWIALAVAFALADRVVPAVVAALALAAAMIVCGVAQPDRFARNNIPAYAYPLKTQDLARFPPSQLQSRLTKAQADARTEADKYMSSNPKPLLDMETAYHRVSVIQDGPSRELVFGKIGFRHPPQTVVDLRNLNWHVAEYTQMMMAGMLFKPAPKRICVIGVGGGVVPRALELCCPGAKIDAVDIDPVVLDIAKKYFYWRPSRNVRVFAQDGRSFINWAVVNKQPLYDWIVLDAYNDEYVPFHLTTAEFMAVVQRMLTPNGVVTANLGIEDDFYGYEARTLNAVYGNLTVFLGHRSANAILVAQNGATKPLTVKQATEAARKLHLPREVDPRFLVSCLLREPNWSTEGPILQDTWAPVENLIR